MLLSLEVTAVSGDPPPVPLRLQLDEGSRLLGRNPDNDLVLEDTERMVSGLHARVEATAGEFVLVDLSTNGTYLNDAPDPLPRNQPTRLSDGDLLQIGPYDITVAIAASEATDTGQSQSPSPPDDLFATFIHEGQGAVSANASTVPQSPELDLFAEPTSAHPAPTGAAAGDGPLPGMDQAGAAPDILDLIGGDDRPGDGGLLDQAADPFAQPPDADDLLADPQPGQDAAPPPTPVERAYFQPPVTDRPAERHADQSSVPPAADIPEDYDLLGDLLAPAAPAQPIEPEPNQQETPRDGSGEATQLLPGEPPAQPPEYPQVDAASGAAPEPRVSGPEGQEQPSSAEMDRPQQDSESGEGRWPPAVAPTGADPDFSAPEGEPAVGKAKATDDPPISAAPPQAPDPAPDDPAASSPAPPPLRPQPGRGMPTAQPQSAPAERAALTALLAGLGAGDPAQIADPEAFLREAGALLRTLVGGLSTTLMARTQFKSEMRLGVTTIRAAENNPLKFSVSVDEALERLLLRDAQGFLPAQEAVKQSFEDIQAHEMAMIAGLRSALDELLGRFAPAALEAELADKSLDKLMPMVRKSRCWDLLGERHAQIGAAASEDFMKVFGDAFSRAYDEQVALLAKARRQRDR